MTLQTVQEEDGLIFEMFALCKMFCVASTAVSPAQTSWVCVCVCVFCWDVLSCLSSSRGVPVRNGESLGDVA